MMKEGWEEGRKEWRLAFQLQMLSRHILLEDALCLWQWWNQRWKESLGAIGLRISSAS